MNPYWYASGPGGGGCTEVLQDSSLGTFLCGVLLGMILGAAFTMWVVSTWHARRRAA